MTSSLVGSEMCIRDRSRHDFGLRPRVRPRRDEEDERGAYFALGVYTLYAVSYTHLTLPTICSV
eukprot:5987624-Prorocentrum_lima.AAC.1